MQTDTQPSTPAPEAAAPDERRIRQTVTFRAGGETVAREDVRVTDAYYHGSGIQRACRAVLRKGTIAMAADAEAILEEEQATLRDEARALLAHAARLPRGSARRHAFLRFVTKGI